MPTKFNELLIGAIALVLTIIFVIVIMVLHLYSEQGSTGNDSNLLIVFYVQIMPDDFVMQLHRF